jgi:ATP-binding cassette, subfamily B, bacterial
MDLSGIRNALSNTKRGFAVSWEAARRPMIIGIAGTIFNFTLPHLNGFINGQLTNAIISTARDGLISNGAYLLGAIALLMPFISNAAGIITERQERKQWLKLSEYWELKTIEQKANLDYAAWKSPRINDLENKHREGLNKLNGFTNRSFVMLGNIASIITGAVILSTNTWWVVPLLIIGSTPAILYETKFGRMEWGIWGSKAQTRRLFSYLLNRFSTAEYTAETRILGAIQYFKRKTKELAESFANDQFELNDKSFLPRIGVAAVSQVVIGAVMGYFLYLAFKGHISIGQFTFYLSSIAAMRNSLSGFFIYSSRHMSDNLYVSEFFEYMSAKPVIVSPENGNTIPADKTPAINLKKVSFAYPASPEKTILKNISLEIPAGSRLAIIGHNGAGKSTLLNLLFRFYDPDNGQIMLDGQDLMTYDLNNWWSHIGYIPQTYQFYRGTVAEAIALGDSSIPVDMERVKKAARMARAESFILKYERGYQQVLGEEFDGGVDLSGGEKQKLALARIFYKNPQIYILDEPTSSVDAQAEVEIFEELNALPKDRTVIFISHRFSTVRNADHIVVLDGGCIKEQGSHKELLKKGNLYATLFKQQAKAYK